MFGLVGSSIVPSPASMVHIPFTSESFITRADRRYVPVVVTPSVPASTSLLKSCDVTSTFIELLHCGDYTSQRITFVRLLLKPTMLVS